MRRTLWSLGFVLATALAAHAEPGPAAVLGMPRASLGLPVRARDPGLLPIAHAEQIQPSLGSPAAPLPTPYGLISPQPAPTGALRSDGKGEPPVSGAPYMPPPVDIEDPLIPFPGNVIPSTINNNRFRVSAEYLMWWTNGFNVPALVTTGPAATNGALGGAGVSTLFGNQNLPSTFRNGLRTGFEYWFGPCQCWAFDGHYFMLGQTGNSTGFTSAGDPLLARPFFNVNTGTNSAELVAYPGLFAGGVAIGSSTSLWGADINLRRRLGSNGAGYIDALAGYRFVSLTEELTIAERSTRLGPVVPNPADPSSFIIGGTAFDRFRTSNQFNGAQIGTAMGTTRGRWTFDLRSFIAMGVMSSTVQIDGAQTVTRTDGTTATTPGGLYALNSNIGRYERNHFAVVPEATFNIGYNVTDRFRLFMGYNVLYLSSVARPGDQVDQRLDVNRIPGFPASPAVAAPHPTVPMQDRGFIAQGMNFGLSLRW